MGAKTFLIILLALSIALAWLRSDAPLLNPKGKDVIELSFWNGFTGPDGRTMLELVRQFNERNPDVHVTMQRIAWATYYNKVMVSALDGRGPEVFVLQSGLLPRMDRAGFVDSVNDMFDPAFRAEFPELLMDRVNFGEGQERLIGVPLDTWPQGMYCNADMLKTAGFVNPDGSARPPQTREEFLQAAQAMKIVENNGNVGQWGMAFTQWHNNFMTLVPQFGGDYLDKDGNPILDHPGNIAALQFLADCSLKLQIAPPPEGGVSGWTGFRQGRVGMVFDGIYMVGDLKRLPELPYIGAPIPQIGPMKGTLADSHILCIRKGLSPEAREASKRFIRFISDNSVSWADAGQVPARKSARSSPEFTRFQVQYAFAQQLDHVMYPPKTPSIAELQLHINLAVEKALRGRMTAEQALKEANENYRHYLSRDRMERESLKEAMK